MNVTDTARAMEWAGLAYKKIPTHIPGTVLTVIDDRATGVQCYVRRQDDRLDITFRGSSSDRDWMHNLYFFKKQVPYDGVNPCVKVHAGFVNAYKSPGVRDRLLRLITGDVRRVCVCGHSYGAALAVLCAVDLEYHFPTLDYEVLLFGCPRVGNRAFRKSYNKRVFKTLRVENGNDIVTKVPPALFGFRHVGIPIHVGPPRLPVVCSLEQHRPQRYLSSIFKEWLP